MTLQICSERRRLLDTVGHIVVRGGAGSGKTTIALAKASVDLEANRLGEHGKVLFLSFARATVARVAEQAMATLPREQRARVEINTYHGFAWSVLKSHAYLLGQRPGVSLLMPAMVRGRLAGLDGQARQERQRELFEQEGRIGFDLFASLMTEIFAQSDLLARAYARAYPLIIVDEFQDTNAEEWAMIQCLGRHSTLIALGDPKQRIYDFKGADPKRFDEFIAAFTPAEFDFKSENRRSAGTAITSFADDVLSGGFAAEPYSGVVVTRYPGNSYRPLKAFVMDAANRLNQTGGEWSLAVLVPANALAAGVWDYMRKREHGLGPYFDADILVSSEGPMMAARLICLLLEPEADRQARACAVLRAIGAFSLGRADNAKAGAIKFAQQCSGLAAKVEKDFTKLDSLVLGKGVAALLEAVSALRLRGNPMGDWLAVRRLMEASERKEIQAIGVEARHMRLLRRGAQIEARLAEAWRTTGTYQDARALLDAAVLEDQFLATTRPMSGVTIMTIHKAKGKEFDEVIVYEGAYSRFLKKNADAEGVRSARYNLHVAATRARRSVTIFTPANDPSPLLP